MADEIKKVVEDLGATFEQFKQKNDERLAQIEKKGFADPLVEQQVQKFSERISELDEMKSRLDQAETALARKAVSAETGNPSEVEKHAKEFATLTAKLRNIPVNREFGARDLQAYKAAFTQFMRGREDEPEITKALSVGSDPDGGYLVTPDTSGRIVQKVFETSPMRQVAAVQTISTDALEGTFDLDEASAAWVAETGGRGSTNTPQLAKWRIPVHELYAFPFATQKLLDDAMVDVESWLAAKVSDKFARTENNAFVVGDGNGKPRGFLTYPAGTTIPGTIEQFKTGVNGGFATNGTGADCLLDMIYGLKQSYRSGSRWFMGRASTAEVRKLKDSDGQYLWQPGIAAGQPATLLGYSVLEFEDMPAIDTGSLSIAFGNMGEAYQIVDRQGIRVLRDPYTNKPYVGFYTVKRTGGDVVNFEAIKLLNFATA